MITKEQRKRFKDSIVANSWNGDAADVSGYVAVRVGEWCAIGYYSHNSVYDTWDDLTSEQTEEPNWVWTGSYEELLSMARRTADPNMPERGACCTDHDYDQLKSLYLTVLNNHKPVVKTKAKDLRTGDVFTVPGFPQRYVHILGTYDKLNGVSVWGVCMFFEDYQNKEMDKDVTFQMHVDSVVDVVDKVKRAHVAHICLPPE